MIGPHSAATNPVGIEFDPQFSNYRVRHGRGRETLCLLGANATEMKFK